MRLLKSQHVRAVWAISLLLLCPAPAWAQGPSAIQFFMPGGGLPTRSLRFTLILPDGRQEILLTDTKGKFSITGDLVRQGEYSLNIEGDKRTFETTSLRFRLPRGAISYQPVFLRPMKSVAPTKAAADVAEYDKKTPPEARAVHEQATKLANQNKPDEAISEFTRALAIYPQSVRALNELGMLYLKLNRLDEAAAAFTQAVSLNARFYPPQLNLALLRHRQGRYDEAIALFHQLLKDYPTLSSARVVYAESLGATQQWDEAEQQLREALKDPSLGGVERASAHLRLGLKLNRDARYQSAAAEFQQTIALSPNSPTAHLYLGSALVQLKKSEDAERELLKAYELGGKTVAVAQLMLGQLYHDQQKFELALRAFEKFLTDMPNASNAAQVRQTVETLKAMVNK
jgi:tetratricopeptide (TPR) repeat protein